MEELRLAFLVIGAVAIIGILMHGMWSVRRNSQDKGHASLETQGWDDDYDDDMDDGNVDSDADSDSDVILLDPNRKPGNKVEPSIGGDNFDELGIGAVRVVSKSPQANDVEDVKSSSEIESAQQPTESQDVSETNLSENTEDVVKPEIKETQATKPKIYSSVVTQPKPEYAAQQVHAMRSRMSAVDNFDPSDIPEPPPFLLRTNDTDATPQTTVADSTTDLSVTEVDTATKQEEPVVEKSPIQASQGPLEKETKKAEPEPEPEAPVLVEQVAEQKVSLADQARNFVKRSKTEPKARKRKEPQIREDQMKIDFDEPDADIEEKAVTNSKSVDTNAPPEQEVLVLNVRANDDNPIQGAALLPMLLTLGFKFGDQDIFHRHVNSNGKGPVLFSLANMFKPGVFDIDSLENFNTLGVTLFMMLPIEGDPHQVFNMMHNAARKIADEFSAQVFDVRRSALTKQSLQQYVEKIREFERKRIIAR